MAPIEIDICMRLKERLVAPVHVVPRLVTVFLLQSRDRPRRTKTGSRLRSRVGKRWWEMIIFKNTGIATSIPQRQQQL